MTDPHGAPQQPDQTGSGDPASDPVPVQPAPGFAPFGTALQDSEAEDIASLNRRFASVRRSVGALERVLLQGTREFSRRDLAEQQGIPERLVATYWRSLGFTPVDEDTVVFTEEDAYAIGDLVAIVEDGTLSERAFTSMSRGLGYHMGRLAMWITEALVDESKSTLGMDDAAAREHMLEMIPQMLETLETQVLYTFRRQLAAYAARAGSEVLQASESGHHDEVFPLHRAVGFADLVQFTRLSRTLGGAELADVVGHFEVLCRDIISVGGGRVVKTVGDEIMFLADTPEDGAQIAVSIAEALAADPDLPPVRLGLCWGSMFSRYGDVFGPTVNLAARLESVAEQGTVLVDAETAEAVARALPGGFREARRAEIELHGIGPVDSVVLERGTLAPLDMGL
ncbi:adenylate/guanylate cyclase domain-containing protein [Brachybacterium sp. JHP9]|uniref:Adenylate/guanylate cyclase domain-containing protein n=1 Tax=Brachybacterium equifaecis TaxID=2910770 RepID=A0ABT0R2U9_9MICO|nr:adenylate/guanylate cyclase domain-containing protein [Brachybacterium equifaecis]